MTSQMRILVPALLALLLLPAAAQERASLDPIARHLSDLRAKGVDPEIVRLVDEDLRVDENERRFRESVERLVPRAADRRAILEALEEAKSAHAGQTQTREGHAEGMERIPYVNHPVRVAEMALVELRLSPAAVQAALLHDVVEDTSVTLEDLRKKFSADVIRMVDDCTWKKYETREEYRRRVESLQGESKLVKALDRYHNLIRAFTVRDPDYQERYGREARESYGPAFESKPELRPLRDAFNRLLAGMDGYRDALRAERATASWRLLFPEREVAASDPLQRYRRPDGTVRWNEALRGGALGMLNGTAHFAFSLFLKELAVVAQTGDADRIGEFFDALVESDFYVNYGLFAGGAELGRLGYGRFLRARIKPAFLNGVLRSTVALGVGLALPALIRGRFDGRAFAVSLASLGISSAAVRASISGVTFAANVASGGQLAALGRKILSTARIGSAAGWVYTAVETAVVLYLAERIEAAVDDALAERRARNALEEGLTKLTDDLHNPHMEPSELEAGLENLARGSSEWQAFLLRPLIKEEAALRKRLETVGRDALILAEKRRTMRRAYETSPVMRDLVTRRAGSPEAWLDSVTRRDTQRLQEDAERAYRTYEAERDRILQRLDERDRRSTPLFRDGANPGRLASRVSRNRAQAHEDEEAFLAYVREQLSGRPNASDLLPVIDREIALIEELKKREASLIKPTHTRGIVNGLGGR